MKHFTGPTSLPSIQKPEHRWIGRLLLIGIVLLSQVDLYGSRAEAECMNKLGISLIQRLQELRASAGMDSLLDVTVRLHLRDVHLPEPELPPSRGQEGGKPKAGESLKEPQFDEARRSTIAAAVRPFVSWLRKQGYEVTVIRTRAPVVGVRVPARKVKDIACRTEVAAIDLAVEMRPLAD